jgi:hypothetical protein
MTFVPSEGETGISAKMGIKKDRNNETTGNVTINRPILGGNKGEQQTGRVRSHIM